MVNDEWHLSLPCGFFPDTTPLGRVSFKSEVVFFMVQCLVFISPMLVAPTDLLHAPHEISSVLNVSAQSM